MRWPALSIAAPPELPCATRAVVSSSNRGSLTCPSGSGTNVEMTPLVTVIESNGHAGEPEDGHRLVELKLATLPRAK